MAGLKYFNGKSWEDITREERYFCSHLYHNVIGKEKEFVKWLNEILTPKGLIQLDHKKEWDIGFEVCFYRDFLKANEKTIKSYNEENGANYPPKRTFDLCLFSKDEMIIIEAKAQQGFSTTQMEDIKKDIGFVERITKEFKSPKKAKVILLHSSEYHPKEETVKDIPRFTWANLAEFSELLDDKNKKIFERADKVYNEDKID